MVQMRSDPVCSSAGCTQYKYFNPDKEVTYPMNYKVADFGVDHDVKTGFNSIDIAEKQHTHKWNWKDTEPREVTEYKIGKPLDSEI
jgi:hypothetical protein